MDTIKSPFFIFGQGHRRKLLYKKGSLIDIFSGASLLQTDATGEVINAAAYTVSWQSRRGESIILREDESGIYMDRDGHTTRLDESPVILPSFQGHPYEHWLRILHHEILINIVDGKPLPNFLVYDKPWYRDGALMAMVLERTGNIDLLRDWIHNVDDPFDRNNAGHAEPDNLGQLLYLISLTGDGASHPIVPRILEEARRVTQDGHLTGLTDGRQHPVYQTKWLKFGLGRLGLPDDYHVPVCEDSYAALCWWDKEAIHLPHAWLFENDQDYPYLTWAEAHFRKAPPPLHLAGSGFPLTWESRASEAAYAGMDCIDPQYSANRICMPHTWHAAEMFLYLVACGS